MASRTDFIKIRINLVLDPDNDIDFDSINGLNFKDEFYDKIYEKEDSVRSEIILPINDLAGLHSWAIRLIQSPERKNKFHAHIYLDNQNNYQQVVEIITKGLKDFELTFSFMGDVDSYLAK